MWFLTGTITNAKDNRRYIPVHELSRSLSPIACQILPVSHALPLFPVQNWKKKLIFKLLRNCPEQYSELAKVGDVDSSAGLNAARKLITSLYDLKKKFVSCHENLNKLGVKLATCKDTSLVRLPPSEPFLYQHVLRASLQTKIWLSSNIAKPPPLSPYDYGWRTDAAEPLPAFFEGIMTSDFL
jgi:hypothetical protein